MTAATIDILRTTNTTGVPPVPPEAFQQAAVKIKTGGTIKAIDLFAGAGGFSEGAKMAGVEVVYAANHWPVAIATHQRNHPQAEHDSHDVKVIDWDAIPAHDVQLAAPACQGHSRARGVDRPHHDALRSTADAVIHCAARHRPIACVVENVLELVTVWSEFPRWCADMAALGYAVSPHVIDSADHGVPQNRIRVFIVCTRSRAPLKLDLPKRPHMPIGDVLDFSAGNWSPIEKPDRAPATIARVRAGRAALRTDRFVFPYYKSGSGKTGRSITRPIGTITTRDRWGVVDGDLMRMLSVPEAKAAMGFRSDYELPSDRKTALHLLGNAVCPIVAHDVLTELQARV